MRKHIKEHFKAVIGITVLLMCTILFITSNELLAKLLPDASELEFVSATLENEVYEYTGDEILPEISSLSLMNKDGVEVEITSDAFEVVQYLKNTEIGHADIEVSLEGYRNTILCEDIFEIVLGKVKEISVSESEEGKVFLQWEKVPGADTYKVYKSVDKEETYVEVAVVSANGLLTYEECNIEPNTIYYYKVIPSLNVDGEIMFGQESESVRYVAPLETVVATGAKALNSRSIEVSWELVDGAVTYQVYRSESTNDEPAFLKDMESSEDCSYVDDTCSIGVEYFYYVLACQEVDGEIILGELSNVVSACTSLDKAKLCGSTNGEKTEVTLEWNSVDQAKGYEVYKKADSGFELVKTVTDGSLSWCESGLDAETEYSYKVRAFSEVDGNKVYGEHSGVYTKSVKVNYNYAASSSSAAGSLTAYEGYPYRWGGKSEAGWDCSGFTYCAMKAVYGVDIATSTIEQAYGGSSVSASDRSSWQVGDILIYKKNGKVNHVSIYVGDGKMIHALNEKYDTFIQSVDEYEKWDDNNLSAVRRYL